MKCRFFIPALLLTLSVGTTFGQRGKHGDFVISSDTIVNEFTTLTANASTGSQSLTVSNSSLNDNGRFDNDLEIGDLIMIIQMQGADMLGSQTSAPWGYYSNPNNDGWGSLVAINNCGNYELCEVSDIPGTTSISIRCGLQHNYTASGKVQIIRIPRYKNLTVNGTLSTDSWNGSVGGVLSVEVEETLTVNGTIEANEKGFRGAESWDEPSTINLPHFAISNADAGGLKGEGVRGFMADYDIHGGRYGRGAAINAGGGGNSHNCGGGGGANAGNPSNWVDGRGVPDPAYNNAWDNETINMVGISRSGGGRGGHGHSDADLNANNAGPNDASWNGHERPDYGGLGGRPMDYSTGRLFLGGGGGAGQRNDNYNTGGDGGNGGGLIYLISQGDVIGTGTIEANGANGVNVEGIDPPGWGALNGNDGAGGAGAGGTILLKSDGNIGNLTINANGGNGGDQIIAEGAFYSGSEAEGPGGGGGGGYIALSTNTATISVSGGLNGTTNSSGLTEFPPNGATSGGDGETASLTSFYIEAVNDTICSGTTGNPSVTINGTLPGGTSIIWYNTDGNFIGMGNSITTSNLTSDTTFYVGTCPGTYTIPVSVIIGSSFTADDSNISITDETCGQGDGAINGITITGGALPLVFEWNSIVETSQDINNLSAGDYTLVVSDNNGCSATIGTYTVNDISTMTMNESGVTLTDENCDMVNGTITGITVSGGTAPLTYSWNGNSSSGTDTNGLSAGSYVLQVTDDAGCSISSASYTINNTSAPVIDFSLLNTLDEYCGQANGSITGITVSGGTGNITTTWNGISANLDTSALSSGDYSLIATDEVGCSDSYGPVIIANITGPIIDNTSLSTTDETCGDASGSISGIIVTGGTPSYSYSWNGNTSTSVDTSGLNAGNYDLTVTDSEGCSSTLTGVAINDAGAPTADFIFSPTDPIINEAVTFTNNSSSDATTFLWDFGNGDMSTDENAAITYTSTGIYSVCLTASGACDDSICKTIDVIEESNTSIGVPQAFSPNGDMHNDVLYVRGEGITSFHFILYNRYGEKVFETTDLLTGWDGTFKGKMENNGIFTYFLEYEFVNGERASQKGNISLIK